MLTNQRVFASLPTGDLPRARAFYEGVLGFTPRAVQPAGVTYQAGGGTEFFVYPSSGRAPGSFTQLSVIVDGLADLVVGLKADGVAFESYDFPGFDRTTSIAQSGPHRTAWFKDPDGNLLGLIEMAPPSA